MRYLIISLLIIWIDRNEIFAIEDAPSPLGLLRWEQVPANERPETVPEGLVSIVRPRGTTVFAKERFGEVYSLQFTPDGKQIVAITGFPTQLRVLDAESFADVTPPLNVDLTNGELSPDGNRLLGDCLLEWKEGKFVESGWRHGIYSFARGLKAWSPDGKYAVIGGLSGKEVRLQWWNLSEAVPMAMREVPCQDRIIAIRYSPDGKRIVTGHGGGSILFWDGTQVSSKPIWRHTFEKDERLSDLVFNREGDQLFTLTFGLNQICRWEIGKKGIRFLDNLLLSTNDTAMVMKFNPMRNLLAVGTREQNAIELYQISETDNKHIATLLDGFAGPISKMAFSRDGNKLIASDYCHGLALWDLSSTKPRLLKRWCGSESLPRPYRFSADGSTLLFREDKWAGVARWEEGKHFVCQDRHGYNTDMAISADGKRAANSAEAPDEVGTEGRIQSRDNGKLRYDRMLHVYRLEGKRFKGTHSLGGTLVAGSLFHPRKAELVEFGWFHHGNRLWQLEAKPTSFAAMQPVELPQGFCRNTIRGSFSDDGKYLATLDLKGIDQPKRITLWDGEAWKRLRQWDVSTTWIDVNLSPNGQLLAGLSSDGSVSIHDTATGKLQHTLTRDVEAIQVVWSKNNLELTTLSAPGEIKTWDTRNLTMTGAWQLPRYPLRQTVPALTPLDAPVHRKEYPHLLAPDGVHVVVGNHDGSLYVFRKPK